uniref:Uncharacterized protein n=1 Tax=Anguilla anguilla TaxID=7936 RepID=A0A0E9Q497_ANGAN
MKLTVPSPVYRWEAGESMSPDTLH